MRKQILKLTKGHSTKAERKFMELLKELHIPFRTKVKIAGVEADFLIKRYIIQIDGHPQNPFKNRDVIRAGYIPIHLQNNFISSALKEWLRKL